MRGLFTNKSISIEAGQALSGMADKPHTLRVIRGRVWITVEGVSHDYWLHGGDMLAVVPGRLTVVEADASGGPADIRVEPQQPMLLQLGTQLHRMVRRLAQEKKPNAALARCAAAECKQ